MNEKGGGEFDLFEGFGANTAEFGWDELFPLRHPGISKEDLSTPSAEPSDCEERTRGGERRVELNLFLRSESTPFGAPEAPEDDDDEEEEG